MLERLATLESELSQLRKEHDILAALSDQLRNLGSAIDALRRDIESLSKWRGWLMERLRYYLRTVLFLAAAIGLHLSSGSLAKVLETLLRGLAKGII